MAPVAARLLPGIEQGDTSSLAVTEATIREARAALERAVVKAGLTNDPVGYLLEATSGALGAFLVGIEAVRSPLDQELRAALLLEVGKGTRAGANDAMRVEAMRTHRVFNRDFAVRGSTLKPSKFLISPSVVPLDRSRRGSDANSPEDDPFRECRRRPITADSGLAAVSRQLAKHRFRESRKSRSIWPVY